MEPQSTEHLLKDDVACETAKGSSLLSSRTKRHPLTRGGFLLLLTVIVSACAHGVGSIPNYVEIELPQVPDSVITDEGDGVPLEIKGFEGVQSPNVGIKQVGKVSVGPVVLTQDPQSLLQDTMVRLLGTKGFSSGDSRWALEGNIQEFQVDVDVNLVSGRGDFEGKVTLNLAFVDQETKRAIWENTYRGTYSSRALSARDDEYGRVLQLAFNDMIGAFVRNGSFHANTLLKEDIEEPAQTNIASSPSPPGTKQPVLRKAIVTFPPLPEGAKVRVGLEIYYDRPRELSLLPGAYRIVIETPGHKNFKIKVSLEPEETRSIQVALVKSPKAGTTPRQSQPQREFVAVRFRLPRGTCIVIDRNKLNRHCSVKKLSLPVGTRVIQVRPPQEYLPVEEEIILVAGKDHTFAPTLEQVSGTP